MASNKIIPGLQQTQEVILMAVALAQLTLRINEVVENDEDGLDWLDFLSSFPNLLPAIAGALSAVKTGVEGIDEVTIEFTQMTPVQQQELKDWAKSQVPDLADDKVEQFIKDAFAVVIDIWMLIKTYFLVQQANDTTETGTATPQE